jgi:hypothetical protein
VTFADGKMAILEHTLIRKFAVRLKALIPLPADIRS